MPVPAGDVPADAIAAFAAESVAREDGRFISPAPINVACFNTLSAAPAAEYGSSRPTDEAAEVFTPGGDFDFSALAAAPPTAIEVSGAGARPVSGDTPELEPDRSGEAVDGARGVLLEAARVCN